MADEWAHDYISAINSRDFDTLSLFFEEDAILISPNRPDVQNESTEIRGRQSIRDDWARRLEAADHVDAVLDSVCQGVTGVALVYRCAGQRIVEVLTASDRGMIASCVRYGGITVGGYAFFSYARGSNISAQISEFMQREELPPWIDNALQPGEAWEAVIEQRIAGASAFVVVMDETSAASDYVKKELEIATRLNKPIIPVLVGGKPFPELADRQFIAWNKIALPEYGFSEYLRDLLAPGSVPSEKLQRKRVEYFVKQQLQGFLTPGRGIGEFGVGMLHDFGISDDQPMTSLDSLDWMELSLMINEGAPGFSIEEHMGTNFSECVGHFQTPSDIVNALSNALTWDQIRYLGQHQARMAKGGAA